MNVYILDAGTGRFRGIYYTNLDDMVDFDLRFNGTPIGKAWTAKERFAFVPNRSPKGDTPSYSSHVPAFSVRAARALDDLLRPNGELLPITCEGERYFLLNVTRVVNALDEDNCELERFDDGRIMAIDRYAFIERDLKRVVLFKLVQMPLSWAYVTDSFVERVQSARLEGFRFRLVWSSD